MSKNSSTVKLDTGKKQEKKKLSKGLLALILALLIGTPFVAAAIYNSPGYGNTPGNTVYDNNTGSGVSKEDQDKINEALQNADDKKNGKSGNKGNNNDNDTSDAKTTGKFKSWVRSDDDTDREYAIDKSGELETVGGDPDKPNTVEEKLGELITNIAKTVNEALTKGAIDASTTGIILGNVTKANEAAVPYFFVFDLTDNNVWGTLGAIIYVVVRSAMIGFLFVFVLYALVKTMWTSQAGKDLASLKEVVFAAAIAMVLLFLMPQIVDWLCNIRDALQVVLYKAMTSETSGVTTKYAISEGSKLSKELAANEKAQAALSGGGHWNGQGGRTTIKDLTEQYYYLWSDGSDDGTLPAKTFSTALIYFCFCFIPFFYMASYVKIALEQMVLFGSFPAFCVLSVRNKNLMSNWFTTFVANIFIPAIDTVIVMIPMMFLNMVTSKGVDSGSFILGIMVIISMTAAIPARNKLLQMLGAAFGVQMGGHGLAALAGMGAMALGAAKDLIGGSKGGGGGDRDDKVSGKDEAAAEDAARAEGKDLGDQMKELNDVGSESTADNGVAQEDGRAELADVNGEDTNAPLDGEEKQEEIEAETDAEAGGEGTEGVEVDEEVAGDGTEGTDEVPEEGEEAELNADAGAEGAEGEDVTGDETPPDTSEMSPADFEEEAAKGDDGNVSGEELADVKAEGMVADPKMREEIDKAADYRMGQKEPGESQQEFDAKKAEVANNMSNRASNLERMDKLNAASDKIKTANADAELKANGHRDRMNSYNDEIRNLEKQNGELSHNRPANDIVLSGGMTATQHKIDENNAKIAELEKKRDDEKARMVAEQNRVKDNNRSLARIDAEMDKRRNIEQGFAAAEGRAGHSKEAFDNAREYRRSLAAENRAHQAAGYQNFQSKDVQGVLSTREKKQYQSMANRRQVARTAGMVAGAAVGVGVVAGGTLASAYGGEEQMASVAQTLGSNGVSMAAKAGGAAGGGAAAAASHAASHFDSSSRAYGQNPSRGKQRKAAMAQRVQNESNRRAAQQAARAEAARQAEFAAQHKANRTVTTSYTEETIDRRTGQTSTVTHTANYDREQYKQFQESTRRNGEVSQGPVIIGNTNDGGHYTAGTPTPTANTGSQTRPADNHQTLTEDQKQEQENSRRLGENLSAMREHAEDIAGNTNPHPPKNE